MIKRPARKTIPVFASEAEEREFWKTHDTTPFVDWSTARVGVFPHLKPSTETISLRLPAALLAELKALANKRDVPYQSLLKVFLAERVHRETHGPSTPASRSPRPRKARRQPRKPPASRAREIVGVGCQWGTVTDDPVPEPALHKGAGAVLHHRRGGNGDAHEREAPRQLAEPRDGPG